VKYAVKKTPEAFTPIDVTITLESQAELNALMSVANCPAISAALHGIGLPDPLSEELVTLLRSNKAESKHYDLVKELRDQV
jgi:hypothetical protein